MRLFLLLILFTCALLAGALRQEQLHVVYTYNFLKNINWNDSDKTAVYNLLILTDNDYLKENFVLLANKRNEESKKIYVSFEQKQPLNKYNAIFIDKNLLWKYDEIYSKVEGSQTLLISVENRDKQHVMINLIKKNTDNLHFEIHRANIINQDLGISDEMILLGGTEIDVAKLYKQTRKSLEHEEERSKKLNTKIIDAQKINETLASDIIKQNRLLTKQYSTISEQKKKITQQNIEVAKQGKLVSSLKNEVTVNQDILRKISEQFIVMSGEIENQQQYLDNLNNTTSLKDKEIVGQNKILSQLKKLITNHRSELLLKEETISSQKSAIIILVLFIVIVTVLIFFLIKILKENKRYAERDFLTGLYNRRYFSKKAGIIHQKSVSKRKLLTLAMIDIDFFKSINDTYGHDTGDEALIIVSSVIEDILKEKALLARWGGEEFIILSSIPKEEIYSLFTTLKEKIALHVINTKEHDNINLTVSTGIYSSNEGVSLDNMIKEADKLLFNAKEQGRNCIVHNDI